MKLLTAEEILEKDDSTFEDVDVPEWGGAVRIQALTADQRDVYEESIIKVSGEGKKRSRDVIMRGIRAKLVAASAVNERGERLFTVAMVDRLGKKSAAALDRLFAVAQRLSALDEEDVEKLAGKSEADPNSASSTS